MGGLTEKKTDVSFYAHVEMTWGDPHERKGSESTASRTRLAIHDSNKPLHLSLSLFSLAVSSTGLAAQCTQGSWQAPFDHDSSVVVQPATCTPNPAITFPSPFLAVHMSVIPKGAHQGHVLVWEHLHYTAAPAGQTRALTYAIVDPINKQFWNFIICMPTGEGDLFCAGHAWNARGDLLVAGGTCSATIRLSRQRQLHLPI